MATVINMPRLSDTMEEGVVAKWLKNVGDLVEEGDILAEIETDKATMEFESFYQGILLHIGIKEGETAPVDSLLAIIGKQGEDISNLLSEKTEKDTEKENIQHKQTVPKATISSKELQISEDIQIIKMPRLSDTMTEGTVACWLKNIGDLVEEGDILAEIETDKATMEFESFYQGTLLHIGIKEGQSASVDSLLAIIGNKGADISSVVENYDKENSNSVVLPEKNKISNVLESKEEKTMHVSDDSNRKIFASPLAKKMAKDKGITLSKVKGSGDNGRIIKRDIENYNLSAEAISNEKINSQVISNVVPLAEEYTEDIKNSQMRKVIAKRLSESKFTAPHYYLTIEVIMDAAIASRNTINEIPEVKVSFNDMIVKACAMALRKHPQVNTSWNEDITSYHNHINIGVAVAVDEGLLVPVLKFTDQMSLVQIGDRVRELAKKARNKKIAPNEMEGSTFTISNLGMFGIEEFTSIINQPNSAILSVGAIIEKPISKNGQILIGNTMKVTLACDHRTVDGATGAQFLQTLKIFLENPVTMLA